MTRFRRAKMFECKYKLELEDNIICAKRVYRSQKRTRDKVIAVLIPILLVLSVVMLILDIVNNKSIVLDIILVIALLVLGVMQILMPTMLINAQKKSFKQQKLAEMDELRVKIEDALCVETLIKDEKEIAKNIHNLKQLTSYIEDAERLILVFNNVEFVCIRKNVLTGDVNKLKAHLQKAMAKKK